MEDPSSASPGAVRPASAADAEFLARGNIDMAQETEDLRLDEATVRRGVDAVLSDASKGLFYILEIDGRAAAQLLVTFEWSDWRNGQYWWIQSVFVVKDHRRKGCFRQLYRHVKDAARGEGAAGVRLYADTQNARANATYEALGMSSHYQVWEELFG